LPDPAQAARQISLEQMACPSQWTSAIAAKEYLCILRALAKLLVFTDLLLRISSKILITQ